MGDRALSSCSNATRWHRRLWKALLQADRKHGTIGLQNSLPDAPAAEDVLARFEFDRVSENIQAYAALSCGNTMQQVRNRRNAMQREAAWEEGWRGGGNWHAATHLDTEWDAKRVRPWQMQRLHSALGTATRRPGPERARAWARAVPAPHFVWLR